jgi:Domain of unknown function (DUF5615)
VTPDRIFSNLYLDEDVSVLIAELLRPHGFDVLTTREAHNLGQFDSFQLQFAASQQRAMLTHNRGDFESLHRSALAEQHPHAGIIIANRRASDADVARRVMKLLNLLSAEEMKNQLLYI